VPTDGLCDDVVRRNTDILAGDDDQSPPCRTPTPTIECQSSALGNFAVAASDRLLQQARGEPGINVEWEDLGIIRDEMS